MCVWLALLGLVVASVLAYPSLPDQIPQHINGSGKATRFVARSPVSWGFPVLIALASVVLVDVLAARLPRNVALFNFPGKEDLLKLPEAYRAEPVRYMQRFMDYVNLQLVVTFGVVQWMMWRGAHGAASQNASIAMLVLSPVLLVFVGLYIQKIQNAVDEATRQYESRRNPLHG